LFEKRQVALQLDQQWWKRGFETNYGIPPWLDFSGFYRKSRPRKGLVI
jgi:hypothetical protein